MTALPFALTAPAPCRTGQGYGGSYDARLIWELYQQGCNANQIVEAYNRQHPDDDIYTAMVNYVLKRLGAILKPSGSSIKNDEVWGQISTRAKNALISMGFKNPDELPQDVEGFRDFLDRFNREYNVGKMTIDEIRIRFAPQLPEYQAVVASPTQSIKPELAQFSNQELLAEIAQRLGVE